ncbi:hypothetical protein TWF506_011486 [Arthrobotrys conoides]|uniref:Clr5 domain-containing protein n=1 Tax=Arthrobotrys conoides TaxID=74498 RepID=A0AAN8RS37_9PEZI
MAEQHSNSGILANGRRARLTAEVWELYKARIRQLYLEQDKSAADTIRIIENESGFAPSVAQFNHQVKIWGLRKNLSEQDLDFIENRKRQRDKEGKKSLIALCDIPINIDDLPRKRQRKFYPIQKRFQGKNNAETVCPSTPPGLFVGTPPPRSPLQARSPSPFSWLVEEFGEILDPQSFPFTINPLYLKTPSYSFETILIKTRANFLKDLSSTSRRNQDIEQRNIFAPSSIKGYQLRNLTSPFNIIHGRLALEDLMSILKVQIIRLGNNVDEVQVQSEILDTLLQSNLLTAHMPVLSQLLQVDNAMVNSFVIQLFYSAARTGILDPLRLILQLYDQNTHHKAFWQNNRHLIIATATQFALERQQGAGFSLLLSTGFDVNTSPLSPISKSLLHTAVMVGDIDAVRELIRCGAKDIFDKDLATCLRNGYIEQLEDMGYSWAKTVRQYANLSYEAPTENSLHLAIILHKKDITELLLSRVEEGMRSFTYSEVDPSKLHFHAVLVDDSELLQYILNSTDLAIDIEEERATGATARGETALVSAVSKMRQRCVKTLLENGADPKALINRADLFLYKWDKTREFLDEMELTGVASKIEKILKEIASRKATISQWGWGNRGVPIDIRGSFPDIGRNKAEVFRYIDIIFGAYNKKGAEFKYTICVFEHLVKEIKFSIWEEEEKIYINMIGIPWDSDNVSDIASVVGHIDKCLGVRIGIVHSIIEVFESLPLSQKQELLNRGIQYSFPLHTRREETLLEWERSCMDRVDFMTGEVYRKALNDRGDDNGDGDSEGDDDIEFYGRICYKLNFASAMSRLRKLDAQLKLKEFGELDFILEWALSVSNAQFLRNLVALCLPYINSLTLIQRQALLRLAVRQGFQVVVEKILNSVDGASCVTDMVLREAVSSDDTAIFDIIMDVYDLQPPSPNVIEPILVIPICSAHLHKVMRMVGTEGFRVDLLFGDTFTCIELAARLGRIDITQVLLNKVASRNLDCAINAALDSGHFALAEMIEAASENGLNADASEHASPVLSPQPNNSLDQLLIPSVRGSTDGSSGGVARCVADKHPTELSIGTARFVNDPSQTM